MDKNTLNDWIDIESAKERFMANEELYKRFLFELPERTLFDDLKAAISQGDVENSFQVAHKMKGVVESISLSILGKHISEVVEILRKDELPDQHTMDELSSVYQQTTEKIEEIKKNNITLF